MDPIWAKFSEYGLVGVIIGILFFIVWKILLWVMAWVDKQAIQQAEERKCFIMQIGEITKALENHNSNAREFHNQVAEAHKFQREEHREMIASLGRINGYKKDDS